MDININVGCFQYKIFLRGQTDSARNSNTIYSNALQQSLIIRGQNQATEIVLKFKIFHNTKNRSIYL